MPTFICWRLELNWNCIWADIIIWCLEFWASYWVLYIQGVSRLVDITAGGDFLGLCDRKSSYKHVSDFGRLWSYGHFLIPVHALMWTASYGLSGGLPFALQALFLPPDLPTQLQTVQFPYLDTWEVRNAGQVGWVGGYLPGQCILHDSATTVCSKTLITYITVTVLAPDFQNITAIVS